jgi:uncharacterized repeat protein (TIGR03847 family)
MTDETAVDLDPATFITVGAQGPPGERTFYLQAAQSQRVVSLIIEKEQAIALAASIDRLALGVLRRDPSRSAALEAPAGNLELLLPLQPLFRVAEMGIGVDEERGVFVLVAQDEPEEEGPSRRARFVATFAQMVALARQALHVAQQGRPTCPLCGRPMEPDGHFCPRANGHDHLRD